MLLSINTLIEMKKIFFVVATTLAIVSLILVLSSEKFALCFTKCTPKPQMDELTIRVDLDNPVEASLFDYFSSIELLPLETSPDALIAGVSKMVIHQNSYYVLDKRQCIIFVFDKAGKYLFKIDKKGQGVGEYAFISDFNINPYTGNLEILEPTGHVKIYDSLGSFIEQKRIKYPGFRAAHSLIAIDSETHVLHSRFEQKKIIYFNLDEKRLLSEEFEEHSDLGSYSGDPYQYRGEWYFFRPIHPVVYKIEKEELKAAFRFDFGKYATDGRSVTISKGITFAEQTEEMFHQFSYIIQSVRHNDKYILASLLWKNPSEYNGPRGNIIYNKLSGKSKFILDFTEDVLFNSCQGEEILLTDEYALMPTQWVDLEKRIKKEMLSPKQQAIFERLVNAEEEANPVLIKYNFK